MTMKGEKSAREVVKFFRSQSQQEESVKLLGFKVQLKQFNRNAYETSRYIEVNFPQYTAHAKEDSIDKLSISYRKLEPIDDCVSDKRKVCDMVIALWEAQKHQAWEIELVSIKVILPKCADAQEIASFICKNYPKYKAHPKYQGEYPIVAIGNQ